MKKNKRNIILCAFLIILAIAFTLIVKFVNVQPTGVNNTDIGLATINHSVFDSIGESSIWYKITKYLGIVLALYAVTYLGIGLVQLIKRKSLAKVDKEIKLLGLFYLAVLAIYFLFDKVIIINYRPILVNGVAEASYPSSHTLFSVCLCVSSILINRKLFNNKYTKILNVITFILMVTIVVGRLLSGVHWFTDIIGGILISSALLMTLYSLMSASKKEKEKEKKVEKE